MIIFPLFSCDFFSTPKVPEDVDGAFQDFIKNLKLSQSSSDCSFFDTRTGHGSGGTKNSKSYEKKFSKEYNNFWEHSSDIPEILKETIIEKQTVTQSGTYRRNPSPNQNTILYTYQNYGLKLASITGAIVATDVNKNQGTMNIKGMLEISELYKARIEICNLGINNKSDHSNCAKIESLENRSDSEKWWIRVHYENPKTKQQMFVEFNESNKEQKRTLLESLLQKNDGGKIGFYF